MALRIRILLALLVGVSAYFPALWIEIWLIQRFLPRDSANQASFWMALATALTAGLCILRNTADAEVDAVRYVLRGTVFSGLGGFLLGFIGPLVLWPGSNQGPLLGFFFTGPLFLVVGAFLSAALASRASRAQQ